MTIAMIVTFSIAGLMGIFLLLDTAWALEINSLIHPVIGNTETQPSRTLYHRLNQGAAKMPVSVKRNEAVMNKMNYLMANRTIQNLKAPDAFKARGPVTEPVNTNRIPRPDGRIQ